MNISELLSNPSMIHAAIVHMPIAAAFIGLIFVILSALFHRNNTVRALTALLFVIVVVSAYVAIESGEDARELVPSSMPTAVWDQLSAHKAAAENVLYASAFTLVCLVLSLIRFDAIRIGGLLLAAVGAIATNIFCANTGHLGGALVYNHGVGTPLVHQAAPAPAPEPVSPTPAPVMPGESAVPAVPAEPMPAEPMPTPGEPTPVEAPRAEPVPVALAENPEWLPIREFTAEEAALVSFKRDVWPIIDDQCTSCHENPDADADYDMTTVEGMAKGGKKGGPGIVPGNPDESSIIKYIRGIANPRMPEDEPPLSADQVHTLRMWIAAGAKDDSAETPAAPEITPAPEAVPLPAKIPVEAAEVVRILSIDASGVHKLGDEVVEASTLVEKLKDELVANPGLVLHVDCSSDTPFEYLTTAIDAAHAAGVSKISVVGTTVQNNPETQIGLEASPNTPAPVTETTEPVVDPPSATPVGEASSPVTEPVVESAPSVESTVPVEVPLVETPVAG